MTLTEFLAELRKTRNGWTADGFLRKKARLGHHCPVTAVCSRVKKTRFYPGDAEVAGRRLGLGLDLTNRIIYAADSHHAQYAWLRSRLLKAVGK